MALYINGILIIEDSFDAVGMTVTNDGTKTTFLGKTGDYNRIGDAGATAHALNSEDDLMVSGELEVKGTTHFDGLVQVIANLAFRGDANYLLFGATDDGTMHYQISDSDARCMVLTVDESDDSGNNVPAWVFGEQTNLLSADLGLLDEVVQPHLVTVENSGKYAGVSNATSVAAAIRLTTATAGTFTNAVVGDLVRVTAGTNATVGWYFVDAVVDQYSVDLDRNWCSGAVSGGVCVACHKLAMMTPKAIYLPIYDAAPADSDIDINMDGAMALEVTQANGRLYWRANNGWHYVDASAGLSLPKEERIDPDGNKFELGDTVELMIDRINDDGSFHAMPYRSNNGT